jgi:D-3-phosphoglycerate dehydrogenase
MNHQPKVLITDLVHPLLISGLTDAGFICHYEPEINYQQVLEKIDSYLGIIINSKIIVDKIFLDKASQLQFIARLGSGLEIIDLDYAKTKNVLVHRSPDGNCDAVAEHAIGMLLSLMNNLCRANSEIRNKIWNRESLRGYELKGKTVGIIGFGFTGAAFAKKLSGFDVKVIAYDKYKSGYSKNMDYVIESESLDLIFKEADIISLHLPLTEETKYFANEIFFKNFKKTIYFINTSRGEIVDTKDLLNALDQGFVQGACLDVFENEKVHTYSTYEEKLYVNLYERENVILSPHVAGWTYESKEKLSSLLLERIIAQSGSI